MVKLFSNDFPALLPPPGPSVPTAPHPLLRTDSVEGKCDVLIFHPRHDLTLARLDVGDIQKVIEAWQRIYKERGAEKGLKYVQIFEVRGFNSREFKLDPLLNVMHGSQNKGAMMGCSNPHPHGQIWSLSEVPQVPATEMASLRRYAETNQAPSSAPKGPGGRPCLLCEYAHFEVGVAESEGRVVLKNNDWVALVPWWAVWPFETLGTSCYDWR